MSVGRHTLYNLAGSVAPMVVSIVTVPIYLHLVGPTRYGVLSIVWLFLGYFGLFDPGLSRAATYHIARLHDAPAKERGDVFWTALVVNAGFGIVGGLVLYAVERPLFMGAFKMPEAMRGEVLACLPWLAMSIPVSIVSGVLGSVLQAREWFGVSNAINVFSVFVTQMVPLGIAYFHGPDLVWLIPAILLARAAGAVPMCWAVARALPLGGGGGFRKSLLRGLFSYGGWITISNSLNPILNTADRLLISSVLSAESVAFYAVALNLVSRVSVLPGAISGSLFPRLSRDRQTDSLQLAGDSILVLAAIMTPLVVLGILVMPMFMKLWVGLTFAEHSTRVAEILLIGVWINGLAYIPSGQLQAMSRPDLTAKFHAAEFLPFLCVLWLGVHYYGLSGAAWAWTFRVALDSALLFVVAGHWNALVKLIPGTLLILLAPLVSPTSLFDSRSFFAAVLMALSLSWSWQLAPALRVAVITKLRFSVLKKVEQ